MQKEYDTKTGTNKRYKKEKIDHNSVYIIDKMNVEETWTNRQTSATTYFTTTLKTLQSLKVQKTESDDNVCQRRTQKVDEKNSFLNDSTLSEYPDKRSLENGLFFDPNYYLSCAQEDIILGKYNYEEQKIQLPIKEYNYLYSTYYREEQVIAKGENIHSVWLSDTCIDAAAVCLAKHRKHLYYVNCISSYILFQNENKNYFSKFHPFRKSFSDVTFIVLPYNANNAHWALIVLVMLTK